MNSFFDAANYHLTFSTFPPLIAGVLVLLLGVSAFIWEMASLVSGVFFCLTLSGAVWLVGYGITYATQDPTLALSWIKFSHLGVSLIPSFILFVMLIITRRLWSGFFFLIFSFLFSLYSCWEVFWGRWWIVGTYHYPWGYYAQYGSFGYPFLIFFFTVCVAGLGLLWMEYRKTKMPAARSRYRAWIIAFAVAYIGAVDYLPAFGIPVYPFGYLPVMAFTFMAAQTIRKYHFSDITPAFAANQVLETMQGAVLVVDQEGKICVANRAACDMLGYHKGEILNKPLIRIVEKPIREEIRNYYTTWSKKDGSKVGVSVSVAVLKGREDKTQGMVYVANDITQRLQTEESLRESEEKYRSLAASANDALISANGEGNIIFWNRGAQNIFGYEEKEVLGKPLTVLMPERFKERHRQGIRQTTATGTGKLIGKTVELVGVRKDGGEFPIELSLSSWQTREGIFYSAILRDISLRKRLEEERDRFFNVSLDMLCVMDFDGHFKQLNPAWERTLGWPSEVLMSKPVMEFVHHEDREATLAESQKLFSGEPSSTFENRYLCKDGTYKWLLWNAIPLVEKKIIYGAARDITERKRSKEMRLRLASIVDSTGDSILGMSLEGVIRSCNPGAEKIYGYSAQEMIGSPLRLLIPKDRPHEFPMILEHIQKGGRLENYETTWIRKDGAEIEMSLTVSPIRDEFGKTIGISVIGRDITKLKEAEEALRRQKDLEMKSNFVSLVSHELRTPLTAMKMGVDILGHEKAPEDQKEWLEMIRRNMERLTRLIDKVLDFQKLDAQQLEYEFTKEDLNQLISELAKTMRSLAEQKKLHFELHLDEALPEVRVDKDRIIEVLMNLISNAIRFTNKGKIGVATKKGDGFVEVSVSDTGIGIRQDDLPKLFTFFRQVGTDKKTGGTGLGLAISKKIIEQHGGTIRVESVFGRGSKFIFQLPIGDRSS